MPQSARQQRADRSAARATRNRQDAEANAMPRPHDRPPMRGESALERQVREYWDSPARRRERGFRER